jgi:hypothetical protein
MDYVKKYDDFTDIKSEISKYVELLMTQRELPNQNEIKAIAKNIIFLKTVVNFCDESHYKQNFIFDVLSVMHSLTQNSIRQFNYIYRSLLENYIRSMLNLEDSDETGVNNLFREMYEKFAENEDSKRIIDFISGEYGKACLFVHSNVKADTSIQLFYENIISNDDFNRNIHKTTIIRILLLLKNMTTLLIYNFSNVVENAFYRRKQHIRFLLGNELYEIFLSVIKENETALTKK